MNEHNDIMMQAQDNDNDDDSASDFSDEDWDADYYRREFRVRVENFALEGINEKRLKTRYIPNEDEMLTISGIKTEEDFWYLHLLNHLRTIRSYNRLWYRIDLYCHRDDDERAFAALIASCANSTRELNVWGISNYASFESLRDVLLSSTPLEYIEISPRESPDNRMMAAFAEGISRSSIPRLSLYGNWHTTGNAAILAEGLSHNEALQNLTLRSCWLEEHALESICIGLRHHSALKRFKYDHHWPLSNQEVSAVGTMLSSPTCGIQQLQLFGKNHVSNNTRHDLSILARNFTRPNLSLKDLSLYSWDLEDSSLGFLLDILHRCPSLTALDLTFNKFSDISRLAREWMYAGTIEKFDISYNGVSAESLLQLVGKMTSLKRLDVGQQSVASIENLLKVLWRNHRLERFVFSFYDTEKSQRPEEVRQISMTGCYLLALNLALRQHEDFETLDFKSWPRLLQHAATFRYDREIIDPEGRIGWLLPLRLECLRDYYARRRFRQVMRASLMYHCLHIMAAKQDLSMHGRLENL
jgi:hypothetical protein